VVGLVVDHRLDPKHFRTVVPGVLYRSASLPVDILAEIIDTHSIRSVVNLRSVEENGREHWHADQAALLAQRGVRFIDLPMEAGQPPSASTLARWLEILDDPDLRPVLVHCEYGVVRTGMMVSVFEMEALRRNNREVWSGFDIFRIDTGEPVLGRIRDFVLGYAPRWRALSERESRR